MRIHICAVGRLKAGAERDLILDYLKRFDRTGRALGLGPVSVIEVEDKKGVGMQAEATLLDKAVPEGSLMCCMDERGRQLSSLDFSDLIANWRDAGRQHAAFLIGGADGLDPSIRDRADFALSFGPMVWPHLLARVMLAEQLYRAASILARTPYHRA